MKAFLAGLIFLIAVSIFAGIGILLFPLLIALALVLRLVMVIMFLLLVIWLLGKFIIFIWEKILR